MLVVAPCRVSESDNTIEVISLRIRQWELGRKCDFGNKVASVTARSTASCSSISVCPGIPMKITWVDSEPKEGRTSWIF